MGAGNLSFSIKTFYFFKYLFLVSLFNTTEFSCSTIRGLYSARAELFEFLTKMAFLGFGTITIIKLNQHPSLSLL